MSRLTNPEPVRMQCMELWGGNQATNKSFSAPGLDLFVYSEPYQASEIGGGDLYYLTSCASGRITRLLLADVIGHGEAVSDIALALRDLLRDNVNKISQQSFIQGMNREFGKVSEENRFATAVVATFFEPKQRLTLGVAGHPNPIYYRASKNKWVDLDAGKVDRARPGNLPLGVIEDSAYPSRAIQVEPGDRFLLYSDALIESRTGDQQMLGTDGIIRILQEMPESPPETIIPHLVETIQQYAAGNLEQDDTTIVLGQFTTTRVGLKDNLLAPFRLFRKARDKTTVACKI